MKPDYWKISQYLNNMEFLIAKIRKEIEEKMVEQQATLHKMSEDGEQDF